MRDQKAATIKEFLNAVEDKNFEHAVAILRANINWAEDALCELRKRNPRLMPSRLLDLTTHLPKGQAVRSVVCTELAKLLSCGPSSQKDGPTNSS